MNYCKTFFEKNKDTIEYNWFLEKKLEIINWLICKLIVIIFFYSLESYVSHPCWIFESKSILSCRNYVFSTHNMICYSFYLVIFSFDKVGWFVGVVHEDPPGGGVADEKPPYHGSEGGQGFKNLVDTIIFSVLKPFVLTRVFN